MQPGLPVFNEKDDCDGNLNLSPALIQKSRTSDTIASVVVPCSPVALPHHFQWMKAVISCSCRPRQILVVFLFDLQRPRWPTPTPRPFGRYHLERIRDLQAFGPGTVLGEVSLMLLVIPAGFYDDLFGIVVRVYPVLSIKTNTSNTYTKAIDRYLYDPVQGLPAPHPHGLGGIPLLLLLLSLLLLLRLLVKTPLLRLTLTLPLPHIPTKHMGGWNSEKCIPTHTIGGGEVGQQTWNIIHIHNICVYIMW